MRGSSESGSTVSRIDSIERTALGVGTALCLGSLVFASLSVTLGVTLGALVVFVNFRWLRRLIERALVKGAGKKKTLYGEYVLKLILFLVIPCVIIYYRRFFFDLDPLAFIVGLSTIFIAVCVEGIRGFIKEAR